VRHVRSLILSEISDVICNQLLHDVVVMYNANRRVGEVQTKSRGMVAGSTRKLFKQKGTGRARAGAIRTPVRRGGGHAFAKKPRDYYYRLPKESCPQSHANGVAEQVPGFTGGDAAELAMHRTKNKNRRPIFERRRIGWQVRLAGHRRSESNVWKSARNIKGVEVMPGQRPECLQSTASATSCDHGG
jgi:large subunit ribosomal protein L4